MKKRISKCLCAVTAAAVLLGGIQIPMSAAAQENVQKEEISPQSGEQGTIVTTREEFMAALENHKSPIIVNNLIVIGKDAAEDGRMLPVKIPANTVIQGNSPDSLLCSRSPIQLEGDGVCFQNMGLQFESSDALGSVPHREIFLAGHSLTMDNVNTYLDGGNGGGGLEGTETELLPTVYAGGFSGTSVGDNASLTVRNSNDETMFQAVYMGHDAGKDNKVPYTGRAVLNLDVKAIVRDKVNTELNSNAEINITGQEGRYARAKSFYGNRNTTLTLSSIIMEDAEVEEIGTIVLKDKACMKPKTPYLYNVDLQNGACLDCSGMGNAEIFGDFSGENNPALSRGILVLDANGSLLIDGNVTGITQFQTESRLFPGALLTEKNYITVLGQKSDSDFVLAQKYIDGGYELKYDRGIWSVEYNQVIDIREIGQIQISSAPFKADLRKIINKGEESIPDENTYFEVRWFDKKGNEFSSSEIIDEYMFYEMDYVIQIRTDYWESDSADILDKTDWYQSVSLMASEAHPGRYYLSAYDGAKTGDYTFLFCSDYFDGDLTTVADVKALKDVVMAERRVIYYDQDAEEPEEPGHTHTYKDVVTEEATCTEAGVRTYTCSECGDNYTEEIAALGHHEVIDPAVEPTETTAGKTEGSHCDVCGTVIKAQEEIPAAGKPENPDEPGHTHTYEDTITKKATCTEAGIRTYTCSECGDTYTEEIAVLNHKYVRKCVPATMTKSGKVRQTCSICSAVRSVVIIASPKKITLSRTDYSYDGKVKTPSVAVTDVKGKRLKAGTDYQVTNPKGRKNPGVYTVTVKFRGNYSGTVIRTFTIRPKKTSLGKITARSKGMQAAWKKQTVQTDGYQIQYSTNGSFKGTTTKSVTAQKNTSVKKISKLKGNKKYYVRIRTYKTVKVGGKNKKLYSDWSLKKTVRTKR